jgi:hypothetical protein
MVALRDRYPASPLCRELHWSAGALRAHLREAEAQSAAPAEFVPLSLETLGLPGAERSAKSSEAFLRLVWERASGTRLQLLLPAPLWARVESLCQAFLHS